MASSNLTDLMNFYAPIEYAFCGNGMYAPPAAYIDEQLA